MVRNKHFGKHKQTLVYLSRFASSNSIRNIYASYTYIIHSHRLIYYINMNLVCTTINTHTQYRAYYCWAMVIWLITKRYEWFGFIFYMRYRSICRFLSYLNFPKKNDYNKFMLIARSDVGTMVWRLTMWGQVYLLRRINNTITHICFMKKL